MNSFDNMDIEDLLNNPLKNVDVTGKVRPPAQEGTPAETPAVRHKPMAPAYRPMADADIQRMEKNQPAADRLLSLEKGIYSADQRVDTLKRIIEEQNERIRKIEEELDMLRVHLKGAPARPDGGEDDDDFDTTGAVE